MKRFAILCAFVAFTTSLNAQVFDFASNKHRFEVGFNFGQSGSFTEYADFGFGVNLLAGGFYLDYIKAGPQHRYDNHVNDTKWHDTVALCVNSGYQIPILSWLRIMPLIGYAQTNEGITDASTININTGENSSSFYHDYDVTPGSRKHYLNYGGGLSIQPCKWFSINAVATRYGLYGGIGINILSFVNQ